MLERAVSLTQLVFSVQDTQVISQLVASCFEPE